MKKRNRILALLLSFAMMLTFMPALAFANEDEEQGGDGGPKFNVWEEVYYSGGGANKERNMSQAIPGMTLKLKPDLDLWDDELDESKFTYEWTCDDTNEDFEVSYWVDGDGDIGGHDESLDGYVTSDFVEITTADNGEATFRFKSLDEVVKKGDANADKLHAAVERGIGLYFKVKAENDGQEASNDFDIWLNDEYWENEYSEALAGMSVGTSRDYTPVLYYVVANAEEGNGGYKRTKVKDPEYKWTMTEGNDFDLQELAGEGYEGDDEEAEGWKNLGETGLIDNDDFKITEAGGIFTVSRESTECRTLWLVSKVPAKMEAGETVRYAYPVMSYKFDEQATNLDDYYADIAGAVDVPDKGMVLSTDKSSGITLDVKVIWDGIVLPDEFYDLKIYPVTGGDDEKDEPELGEAVQNGNIALNNGKGTFCVYAEAKDNYGFTGFTDNRFIDIENTNDLSNWEVKIKGQDERGRVLVNNNSGIALEATVCRGETVLDPSNYDLKIQKEIGYNEEQHESIFGEPVANGNLELDEDGRATYIVYAVAKGSVYSGETLHNNYVDLVNEKTLPASTVTVEGARLVDKNWMITPMFDLFYAYSNADNLDELATTVKIGNKLLEAGTDYEISYKEAELNTQVFEDGDDEFVVWHVDEKEGGKSYDECPTVEGVYKIVLTGKGDYEGSVYDQTGIQIYTPEFSATACDGSHYDGNLSAGNTKTLYIERGARVFVALDYFYPDVAAHGLKPAVGFNDVFIPGDVVFNFKGNGDLSSKGFIVSKGFLKNIKDKFKDIKYDKKFLEEYDDDYTYGIVIDATEVKAGTKAGLHYYLIRGNKDTDWTDWTNSQFWKVLNVEVTANAADAKKKAEAEDKARAEAEAKARAEAEAKAKAEALAKASNINKATVTASDIKKASNLGATSITLGSKVKKIKSGAFKGTKIKTITVKTKKLKAKSVKGSLKGSKVKTIKVKVGKKKDNKTYVKKYKKIFTKKNAGKKATVK